MNASHYVLAKIGKLTFQVSEIFLLQKKANLFCKQNEKLLFVYTTEYEPKIVKKCQSELGFPFK